MPPAKSASAPRRRTRKRKRRAASLSSSSSSSESSSEDESSPRIVRTAPETLKPTEESPESELDSDSSNSSSNSGSGIVSPSRENLPKTTPTPSQKPDKLRRSPSPSPPPAEIPSFLPPRGDPGAEEKEKELKDKFRKFWMASVADGFRDDLEELRKVRVQAQITISLLNSGQEPNLGAGRLALLIDSLASGVEVFSSKADGNVSEMDVMME